MILKDFLLRMRCIDPCKIVRIGVSKEGGWRYWYNLTDMEFVENVLGMDFMECNVLDTYAGYEDDLCIIVDANKKFGRYKERITTKQEFEKRYDVPHLASDMEDIPINEYIKEFTESRIDKGFLVRHL